MGGFSFSFCFHYGTVIVNPMEVRYLEVLMGGSEWANCGVDPVGEREDG